MSDDLARPAGARLVLGSDDLDRDRAWWEALGFRVARIAPADAPRCLELEGHGLRLQLERGSRAPLELELVCDDPAGLEAAAAALRADGGPPAPEGPAAAAPADTDVAALRAPDGSVVRLRGRAVTLDLPAPIEADWCITRAADGDFGMGRAGMGYRDLLPGRLGGRVIASHIRIEAGGPVPDVVHWHAVRCQLIVAVAGWVRLVYEAQGEPFVMQAGDAVLQPPGIRHRVLECSPGLEVIELASPAEHDTHVDHELVLPGGRGDPGRRFAGQAFVWTRGAREPWTPDDTPGWERQGLVDAHASDGRLRACHVRRMTGERPPGDLDGTHRDELRLCHLLAGSLTLRAEGRRDEPLTAGDTWIAPAGVAHALADAGDDARWLEVSIARG